MDRAGVGRPTVKDTSLHEPPDLVNWQLGKYTAFGEIERRLIFFVPLLALSLLGLAAFDVVRVVRSANESGRLLQTSYEIIGDTDDLYAAVSDAETSQRTYLVTNEPAALEGFQQAKIRVFREIGKLAAELDAPQYAPHLKSISRASNGHIAGLHAELDGQRSNKDRSAQIGAGRARMSELRQALSRLVASEERSIEENRIALARDQYVAVFEVLLAIAGLLLAGWIGASAFFRARTQLSDRTNEARAADLKFEATFEQAAIGMSLISPDGRWLRVNDRFSAITGYSREQLIGRNFQEITHPEDVAADAVHISDLLTGRTIQCIAEKRFVRPSGEVVWATASAAMVRGADGKPDFVVKIIEDITERTNAVAALAASEERLRLAQDATGTGSFDWDLATGEFIVNETLFELIGSAPQTKQSAESILLLVHPEDRDRVSASWDNDRANRRSSDIEFRLASVQNAARWVRSMAKTICDANGQPFRRIGVITDITDRKAAEKSLRESREQLRLALASGHLGTWSVDATTGSVDLDSISRSIFDLEPGRNPDLFEFAALIHPDDQARYADEQKGILADAPALNFEFRIVIRDGSIRWIHATGIRFGDEESGDTRMTGVALDVTERKEAVEKLRQSEERLRLALASGDLGTWSFHPKSGVLRFDQLAKSIFGTETDHLDSLDEFKALLHPDDRLVFDREYQKLLAGSDALNVEYRLPQYDGSVRWAQVSGTIDRSVSPDTQELIGVVADVTEKRESGERLRTLQNEFAHLARVNDLGEMAAAIAHEVNQPLTAISNYLNAGIETARKSANHLAQTGAETMMVRAAEQALRAGQIVRRLREFIGKGTGEREARSVEQLIDAATEFAAVDAGVNGVTVIKKSGAGDEIVSVDVVQFQQVVVNLIRNAIYALSTNPPGVERKLTVETNIGDAGKDVEFMIADTGPGIHRDIRPRLFEPFTTSKANGMGMGLSICKRLIEAHGGSMRIDSPASGGTAVRFTLPIEQIGR